MIVDEEKENGETEEAGTASDEQVEAAADETKQAEADADAEATASEEEPAPEADVEAQPEAEAKAEAEAEAEAKDAAEADVEAEPATDAEGAGDDDDASDEPVGAGPVAEGEDAPATPAPPAVRPSRKKRTPEEKAARRTARKRRRVEARAEARKPIVRIPKPEQERGARKERVGVVVADAMDRTITVQVERAFPHRRYGKVIRRTTKFYAHDTENSAAVGDSVRIVETRPLSKNKRWRLAEIVETAK